MYILITKSTTRSLPFLESILEIIAGYCKLKDNFAYFCR